jgi:3-oxoacyl-[acyl-carrier-protein] synthase III
LVIQGLTYHFPARQIDITAASFENKQQYDAHQTFVGTSTFYQASSDLTASDLALNAAMKLLVDVDLNDIDFLIFSSLTLDYHAPSTASILHKKLGLKAACGVMDLTLGCAGFPMALMTANGLFKTMSLKRILVLLGEIPTRAVHPADASLKYVFGDAGVAVMLGQSTDSLCFEFGNDGDGFSSLNVQRGGARFPMDISYLESNREFPWLNQFGALSMDGHGILKLSLTHIPQAVYSLLDKYGLTLDQVDHVIFHQASNIVIDALQRKLNLPKEKVVNYLADGGNTISCGIPIAWAKAQEEMRFKTGDTIMVFGFGVGFSWCGSILTYQ